MFPGLSNKDRGRGERSVSNPFHLLLPSFGPPHSGPTPEPIFVPDRIRPSRSSPWSERRAGNKGSFVSVATPGETWVRQWAVLWKYDWKMASLPCGTSLRMLLYLHSFHLAVDLLVLCRCFTGAVCLHMIIVRIGLWLWFAHLRTACIQR